MKFFDYYDGTSYLFLYKDDFVDESRFKGIADFMNQNRDIIIVPIDSKRARHIVLERAEPKEDVE